MLKILYIEDDPLQRELGEDFLKEDFPCARILTASDAEDAINKIKVAALEKAPFDLIISDFNIPGLRMASRTDPKKTHMQGGVEVLHFLVTEKIATPVIMISGKAYDDVKDIFAAYGIKIMRDHFFAKPVNISDVAKNFFTTCGKITHSNRRITHPLPEPNPK